MMGWQRHQLDHIQIICTSLQTHNHTLVNLAAFSGASANKKLAK